MIGVSTEIKAVCDSIIVPTLTYVSGRWVRNEVQRSRVQAVETSFFCEVLLMLWSLLKEFQRMDVRVG